MSTDIAALVTQYPSLSTVDRDTLLAWIKGVELKYGTWQSFKRLYKKVEANALNAQAQPDWPLLAVLLCRIDGLTLEVQGRQPTITPTQERFVARQATRSLRNDDIELEVGGRTPNDYRGFRLLIRPASSARPGLRERMLAAFRLVNSTNPEVSTPLSAFDIDGRSYIGYNPRITLEGNILKVPGYHQVKEKRIDLSDPTFPYFVGSGPSLETKQYMKRRARRLTRTLAQTQPDRYVALMSEVFRAHGNHAISPHLNWVLMDAFYFASPRWSQPKGGRGPYVRDAGKVVIKRREERAPEIWDVRLDVVRALATNIEVPDAANEMAIKILQSQHAELPELAPQAALKFLRSPLPLLQSLATRALANQLAGLWGTDAALLIVAAHGRLRTALREPLEQLLTMRDTAWRDAFVESLLQQLEGLTDKARGRAVALLLFELFRERLPQSALWMRLRVWLSLGGAAREWALSGVRAAGSRGELAHVTDIARLPEATREDALTAFIDGIAQVAPDANAAYELISTDDTPLAIHLKWQVLAATRVQPETLRAMWLKLTAQTVWRTPLEVRTAALSNPYSAQLFGRIDFGQTWGKVLSWIRESLSLFSSAFLDAVIAKVDQKASALFHYMMYLTPDVRQHILNRYPPLIAQFQPDVSVLRSSLLSYYGRAEAREDLWKFAAMSNPLPATIREVWPQIGSVYFGSAAATLFRKGEFTADEVAAWLPTVQANLPQFEPEYFVAVFEAASDATKVELALNATPPQWDAARTNLLNALDDRALHGAFWRGLWPRLSGPINPELRTRLLDDAQIGGSFERLDGSAFTDLLATASDAHESFVTRWLDAHERSLTLDDMNHRELLVALASSELPDVRRRGLNLIRALGLDVSLALRLMEGGLPEGFAAAREWFESRPPSYAFDDALVLCDSPTKLVRSYGLTFIENRRATLLTPQLISRLMEHPDPAVQGWVAGEIARSESNGVALASREFDATVLKGRGRARAAKETVKRRLTQTDAPSRDTMDEAALLQLARGSIRRDREWALAQLARLSVRGETVTGISARRLDAVSAEPSGAEPA